MTKPTRILLLALSAFGLSAALQAQVLQLDFGPTVVTGTSQTNSPYHTANGTFTDTIWNQVQAVDIAANGLVWSDGTTATGISVNIGATTAPGTALSLANTPSRNDAMGISTNTGIYAGTSVGTDGLFTGNGGNTRAVGVQIAGLSTGTYSVYITARNTSLGAQTQIVYADKASSAGNFNFGTYANQTLTYANSSAFTSSWVAGENYTVFTISITSGEVLNLASLGVSERGVLNSVQIVSSVPEPSSYALLAGAGGLFITAIHRKRRSL